MDGALWAAWAQAIANTVVLFLIYLQMKQVNEQMVQNDEQEKWRRSWEFVKFYREELRSEDQALGDSGEIFDVAKAASVPEAFRLHVKYFYKPRIVLFSLLNQMVQHQEVDERMLFGYLSEDFNKFVEIGISLSNQAEFRKELGPRLNILLQVWGTHIKSSQLLYGVQSGTLPV